MPVFALGLGLLEPTKNPLKSSNIENKLENNDKVEPNHFNGTIPPVQFDWNSSGLTNPLDTSLDLQFFDDIQIKNLGNQKGKYENTGIFIYSCFYQIFNFFFFFI